MALKLVRLRWPTLPPSLVADLLAGHSAVGLALGAMIYLVCVTGTLCVFIDELQLWEAPRPAPAAFDPAQSDRLVAQAVALAGGPAKATQVYLRAPVTPRQRTVIGIGERQWTPSTTGRLVPLALPWTSFLAELHYNLTLPGRWGEMLVGLLGVGLLSLLVSGVLAHPRVLRDAFRLRLGGGRRLQEADLHNRMGVWALPFHVAVTLTGALFGLSPLLAIVIAAAGYHGDVGRAARPLSGPEPVADARPAPLPPLAQAVARSRALRPDSRLYYLSVAHPYTRGAQVAVEVTAPGRLPRGEEAYFDAHGRRVGRMRYASGELGLQLYSGAAQVHFGFFGGLPVRLVYGALGLSLCWVCTGGVSIWLVRRRDQGRPAPRLERAWSAWVWGVPAALALASLAGAACEETFWLVLLAEMTLSQAIPPRTLSASAFDCRCRIVLGLTLAAVGAAWLSKSFTNGAPIVVEAVLLVAALGLVSSCPRPKVAVAAKTGA